MASQVTVCPPYVYQPQTSAFCRAKKIDPSSCVYHEKIPRTYVVGVNLGIAHPTDIFPVSRVEELTSGKPSVSGDFSIKTELSSAPQELIGRASSPYKRVGSEGDLQYFSSVAATVEEESGDSGQNSRSSSSSDGEKRSGLNLADGTQKCGFRCKGEERKNGKSIMQIVEEHSTLPAMLPTNVGSTTTVAVAPPEQNGTG